MVQADSNHHSILSYCHYSHHHRLFPRCLICTFGGVPLVVSLLYLLGYKSIQGSLQGCNHANIVVVKRLKEVSAGKRNFKQHMDLTAGNI